MSKDKLKYGLQLYLAALLSDDENDATTIYPALIEFVAEAIVNGAATISSTDAEKFYSDATEVIEIVKGDIEAALRDAIRKEYETTGAGLF